MTNENQMAVATKNAVRSWTDEEKEIVWEQALKAKEENLPLTEAFRRTSKLLPHRSEAAVGMLYYNVLRKEREEPPIVPKAKAIKTTANLQVDTRLLEAFQGLPEYIQEVNQRIKTLEQRLHEPDPQAILRSLALFMQKQEQQEDIDLRIEKLQEENQALLRANQALQEDLQKLKEAYEDALGIYDMFTNMASISQIMSLGDFKQEMKTTLDKWGNVLDITFSRSR